MSSTELHIGKLRKVDLEGKTLEQFAEEVCRENGVTEIADYCDNWMEQFEAEGGFKHFIVDGEVWKSVEHTGVVDYDDIQLIQPNADGTLSFVMQFYNGGTCLSEMMEEGIRKFNKNQEHE